MEEGGGGPNKWTFLLKLCSVARNVPEADRWSVCPQALDLFDISVSDTERLQRVFGEWRPFQQKNKKKGKSQTLV